MGNGVKVGWGVWVGSGAGVGKGVYVGYGEAVGAGVGVLIGAGVSVYVGRGGTVGVAVEVKVDWIVGIGVGWACSQANNATASARLSPKVAVKNAALDCVMNKNRFRVKIRKKSGNIGRMGSESIA